MLRSDNFEKKKVLKNQSAIGFVSISRAKIITCLDFYSKLFYVFSTSKYYLVFSCIGRVQFGTVDAKAVVEKKTCQLLNLQVGQLLLRLLLKKRLVSCLIYKTLVEIQTEFVFFCSKSWRSKFPDHFTTKSLSGALHNVQKSFSLLNLLSKDVL